MDNSAGFWQYLDHLVERHPVMLDRPRGSTHPRYPGLIYPLDYGYLEGTTTVDGGGIDLWRGASGEDRVTGIICTVDLKKNDAEIKILLGCTSQEVETVLKFVNGNEMRAIYIDRSGNI